MEINNLKSSLTYKMIELIDSGYKCYSDMPRKEQLELIYKYLISIDFDHEITVNAKDLLKMRKEDILHDNLSHLVGEWFDDAADNVNESYKLTSTDEYMMQRHIENLVSDCIPLNEVGGRCFKSHGLC